MNILIDIGHPAHVHLFKHFASEMLQKRNNVLFTVRVKEVNTYLLQKYNFDYKIYGKSYNHITGKFFGLLKFTFELFRIASAYKPDITISHSSFYLSHVSKLIGCTNITLEDSGNREQILLYKPFTNVILTPENYRINHGKKQIRYPGNHELFYLHPNRFKPEPSIYSYLKIDNTTDFCILRFISWGASHDIGKRGLSINQKTELVNELSKKLKVFISSESELPDELQRYELQIPAEKIHDALSFATLVISEGATMASEAAVLGTPTIYINPILRYYNEELVKYKLLFYFRNYNSILYKALETISNSKLKEKWQDNRKIFLSNVIDPTAFFVWLVENIGSISKINFNRDFFKGFS